MKIDQLRDEESDKNSSEKSIIEMYYDDFFQVKQTRSHQKNN